MNCLLSKYKCKSLFSKYTNIYPAVKAEELLIINFFPPSYTGNILLNVLIPPKMPCTRTGKNNVLIVCVPNPPIDEKNPAVPVTMLIRVKTSEDADELHKILLEKKEA